MRIKKILFFGPIPPEVGGNSSGGIASHNFELAQECSKNNYKVFIYSGQNNLQRRINGIVLLSKFTMLNKFTDIKYSPKIKTLLRQLILKSLIKKIEPDIIHFHSLHNKFIDAVDADVRRKRIIIVTDHAFWNNSKNVSKIQNRISKADKIISITNQFNQKLNQYELKVDANKIIKIHHPICSTLYKDIHVKRIDNKIFYSCYSDPLRKGLLNFINLIQNYDLTDYRFSISVNSNGISLLNKHFKIIPSNLRIFNGLSFIDCLKEYASSKLFLLPSYSEGFAMVFREALLAGTAILGYKPNVDEINANYSTYIGESFDINNETEDALFGKIKKVMNAQINHKKIIEETKQNFSWEKQFTKFDDIYRSTVFSHQN